MPRSTTAIVSKYQRNRIWSGEFVRGEAFTLGANFAGVLGSATLSSIVWKVNETQSVILGAAAIAGKVANVACTAGVGCGGVVKCQVTASDGKVFNQIFRVRIQDAPWFSGEVTPAAGNSSASA